MVKTTLHALLWVEEPCPRPDGEKCLVVRVDHAKEGDQPFEIPWPEGMTVVEALQAWALVFAGQVDPKGHWSDCDECYEYHENKHPFADLSDEPAENKDFRHLG